MALAPRKKLRKIPLAEEARERQRQDRLGSFASEEDFERTRLAERAHMGGIGRRDVERHSIEGTEIGRRAERFLNPPPDPTEEGKRRARRAAQAAGGARRRSLLAGGALSPLGPRRSLLGF